MEIGDITNLTDYASKLAQAQNAQKTAESAKAAKSDEEMLDACKEFESYLWEQVLKSMKSASEVFNTEEEDKTVSFFSETAMADIAKQITEQTLGTNSLAMQMYEQMKRNEGLSGEEVREALKAAESKQGNTAVDPEEAVAQAENLIAGIVTGANDDDDSSSAASAFSNIKI
ncbi:MAG: hypothetical protein J6Z42_06545 [Lachnospiraceae bacterium]|nr:hypothetical protein [Lachnospiraceae bacterium]